MVSLLTPLLLPLVLWVAQITAQSVEKTDCATGVHAIFSRGQGEGDDMDVLQTVADLITDEIPGSTYVGLPYPHASYNMIGAVSDGADLIQEYIQQYVDSCPDSKIFILGYSMGAITVMDAVCGTSSILLPAAKAVDQRYIENVIAVVAYGDLTHVPAMPWNTGTCLNGIGVIPRMRPFDCSPFAESLRNYCDDGDKMCCNFFAEGNNNAHHKYFKKYNAEVLQFVKDRLAETKGAENKVSNPWIDT